MYIWAIICLLLALVAGIFGIAGINQQISLYAGIVFFILVTLSVTFFVGGLRKRNTGGE